MNLRFFYSVFERIEFSFKLLGFANYDECSEYTRSTNLEIEKVEDKENSSEISNNVPKSELTYTENIFPYITSPKQTQLPENLDALVQKALMNLNGDDKNEPWLFKNINIPDQINNNCYTYVIKATPCYSRLVIILVNILILNRDLVIVFKHSKVILPTKTNCIHLLKSEVKVT